MTSTIKFHVSEGKFVKLTNQITIASTMVGLVEGMVYVYKAGLDMVLYWTRLCTANLMKFVPPSLAPSSSNGEEKERKSTCHNRLCKQNLGVVAGVVTVGAFVLALFAGALIWLYSKKIKPVSKLQRI